MALYESDLIYLKPLNLQQAMQKKHFDEAFKKKTKVQKLNVSIRRKKIVDYIKETGDKNIARIAVRLKINKTTLTNDIRKMGYHTKGGFIQ